ncbi:MAG: NUDIX domain-containing protein [Clostridia bacterium]|nr:NUDIX domain-containing protein [Clostridia bacterium]
MTDFSGITACGECCAGCPQKADGRCPGCMEADGRVPEWAESGRCKVHACTRDHHVQFCGLCAEFPCAKLPSLISWNEDIVEHMTALRNEYRRIVPIVGDNYFGKWDKTRTACRGIIFRDHRLLLSYETATGQWMLPGGGLEAGEDERQCCIREVAEETGFKIRPTDCVMEIDEYYEDFKWVNRYFFGEIIGETAIHLTQREKETGMEPRWLPPDEIIRIFSEHASYADTDEMRRGMYLREYTALSRLCGGVSSGRQVILLNGPSSSGKSTLGGELQKLIREQEAGNYEVVSIDDFMKSNPMETIYEEDVYAVSGDLCERMLEVLGGGAGVIADHVITSERIFRQLKEMLHAYPLRTVQVTCAPEVLREREQARGDRCIGSAESSAEYLFPKTGYDLTVDTGTKLPRENAQIIYQRFFQHPGD